MFPVSDSVPRRSPPLVVWALIAANALVFVFQIGLPPAAGEWLVYHYGLVPARYTEPRWALLNGLDPNNWLPFLTNTFMHGGWLHILGNMWTLWLFGSAVEDRLGRLRFIVFYLACGLIASVAHFAFNAGSPVPALGASGAISGVMGAYAALFPLARIVFVIPVAFVPLFFDLPALVYAAGWFGIQFLQGTQGLLAPELGAGIAWWAHIGGFIAGLALVWLVRLPRTSCRTYFPDEGRLGFGPRGERR